jgi:hypothetical protein
VLRGFRYRRGVKLVAGIVAMCAARVAHADAHAHPPLYDPSGMDGQGYLGFEASVLPYGTFHIQAGMLGINSDADVGYGLGLNYLERLSDNISIGFSPRVLLHVESADEDYVNTELDLRARLRAGGTVYKHLRLFAELSPGYAIVFPPAAAKSKDPNGFIVGFGGGASWGIARRTAVTLVVGYQQGFEQVANNVASLTDSDSYLEITVGIVRAIR